MDLLSYTFGNLDSFDSKKRLYIDSSDPTRFLTATTSKKLVRQLIAGFKSHGLSSGETVCVISFNDIYYTPLYLSIIGSGGCFTGANPGYTARELKHHLVMTRARFVLTELKTLHVAVKAASECGIPNSNIFVLNYRNELINGDEEAFKSWKSLCGCGESDWMTVDDSNMTAAYISTSGTSGLPKAAIISHGYLIQQAKFQEELLVDDEISQLIALPAFHVFTIPVQHGLPLRTGTPTYIMPRFEPVSFTNAIERFGILQIVTVPPILLALSKASKNQLKSLRRVFVGGSNATEGMQQQLYSKLHTAAKVVQVYGMTEVGWSTCWSRKVRDRSGSVGQSLPGTIIRVVRNGQSVMEDTTGDIEIKCSNQMGGYLDNETATEEAITADGFIRTGDIGYMKNGNWYIIDRSKDLIKVRGNQVSPAEIENALLEHPDIVDAGVIGITIADNCGEVPMAYIVSSSSALDKMEVQNFLRIRLARYKNVEEVKFVDRIPRNPTGKILRRLLRDCREKVEIVPDVKVVEKYRETIVYIDLCQKRKQSMGEELYLGPGRMVSEVGLMDVKRKRVI